MHRSASSHLGSDPRSPFIACRSIAASDVAQREGLHLHQRGSRSWARCPLHGEKTPSLCFYEDGSWHCFGCGKGGDAVAFYAQLEGMPPLEAAKALAASYGLNVTACSTPLPYRKPRPSRAQALMEVVEEYRNKQWDRACRLRSRSLHLIEVSEEQANGDIKKLPDAFWGWISALAAAETRLDELSEATDKDIVYMMLEEKESDAKETGSVRSACQH